MTNSRRIGKRGTGSADGRTIDLEEAATLEAGGKIKAARESAGLSQTQLARAAGVHVTSVSDWERGRNVPSATSRRKLAGALGRDPLDIQGGEDDAEGEADRILGGRLRALVEGIVREALLRERPPVEASRP